MENIGKMSIVHEPTNNSEFNPEFSMHERLEQSSLETTEISGEFFAGPSKRVYSIDNIQRVIDYKDSALLVTTILEEVGLIPTNSEITKLQQQAEIISNDSVDESINSEIQNIFLIQLDQARNLRLAIKNAVDWYKSNISKDKGSIDTDKLEELYDSTDEFEESTLLRIIKSLKTRENESLILESERIARILMSGVAHKN